MAELSVPATLENLELVTGFIHERLKLAGCPAKIMTQVSLAVEEIYVNIAHYAYHPNIGEATVRCEVGGEPLQVTIGFADEGKPYNPLLQKDPDVTQDADQRQIGGLGVFMVKKLMDKITYEFIDGKNVLTIRKRM
ncbi:ATP-binding protein [Anaerotruncus colihominis]|uniref:ATP-binding protein n=1 Tax=Anaerotruncus colihominis TaxID=169435 RepID=UPI0026ECEF0B|nr:ATP-binding protein [Anaerotruncus colihominis]